MGQEMNVRGRTNSSFDEVISCLADIVKNPSSRKELIETILVNIANLKAQFNKCMDLNDDCLVGLDSLTGFEFDKETETFYAVIDGKRTPMLKVNRADPNVPLTVSEPQRFGVFVPSATSPKGHFLAGTAEAQIALAGELQSFYYCANRSWDLIEKDLLGKSSASFIGVKLVRNKLFEHSVKGEINSFGINGNIGPTAKPMRHTATMDEAPYDAGLVPNTDEFLTSCRARIASI